MSRADRLFAPLLAGANWRDRMVATFGALAGIALTALICTRFAGAGGGAGQGAPLLVASMGASAVLVFAVPSSPLGQPWPVIGGSTVSALAGELALHLLGGGWLAAGVAVGLAIAAMSVLRCLHPPGGGAALIPVLGGPAMLAHGYGFALYPVAINAVVLVALGWLFHRFSGHSYPHRAPAPPPGGPLKPEDIDAALAEAGEGFDISHEDLTALIAGAERHARTRMAAGRRRK
ncbi:HPP family protein [Sphingomonas canadensis]|uniref:HPP family protein n=1 Tax=Sphingomonas canadensis TaxID=1219257 RepID=A0ABW3H6E0_9SPHN|nr:HPP family protein [Sphingomonas canadensis]MCW3836355.1 HPP family protein [Sphingomonas canadensis]